VERPPRYNEQNNLSENTSNGYMKIYDVSYTKITEKMDYFEGILSAILFSIPKIQNETFRFGKI
ncbi:MAG: hypothetical protein Q4E53_10275, partial [Eubacteriales bacterium]|nr:hypothetical protein [Eubacteriales bacterium]